MNTLECSGSDPSEPLLSFVMPCLNEERTVGLCIDEAFRFLRENNQSGEVIVADNGSHDTSRSIIESKGAILVEAKSKGYGNALRAALSMARGRFIIMADCDASYDFGLAEPFLEKLRDGADLVIGNRFIGGIEAGAMPRLHQYFGNPLMSWLGRIMFQVPLGDFHCGMRGIRRDHFERLRLTAPGMEFASELIVRTALLSGKIAEVPTKLRRDGRNRPPHLRSFRDGLRHLFLRIRYCADWLLAYPALIGLFLSLGTLGINHSSWVPPLGLFLSSQIFILGTVLTYSVAASGIKERCLLVRSVRPPLFMVMALLAVGMALWIFTTESDISPWGFFILCLIAAEFAFSAQLLLLIGRCVKKVRVLTDPPVGWKPRQ
ncbi:MAG: glycosyltransferase family 2 protein [Planctomycetota bacterium]|nr:glycosyltransferase family 2 protein [Planctomycetota bacterium]